MGSQERTLPTTARERGGATRAGAAARRSTSAPIALKVGLCRVNPALRAGGDGVEVAQLGWLRTLCVKYPSVKLLVTVLSADNQHELCVLARKFGNLHA